MKRVTGIGGIFFRSKNPEDMYQWYDQHLGIKREQGEVIFKWKDQSGKRAMTVWSQFSQSTQYFKDSTSPVMINYRVDNLDALLEALKAEGVRVDEAREESEYGKFGWVTDPEGNRIELWEPPTDNPDTY